MIVDLWVYCLLCDVEEFDEDEVYYDDDGVEYFGENVCVL